MYQKCKKSKAARQDISVKEIDVPFIQSYSMFSLDILCLLQGFKMSHNNLFLHTKPGTHLYLPGQALCLHEGRDPPLNQLIAGRASQVKGRFKTALLLMHQNGMQCQVIRLHKSQFVLVDEKFSGKWQFCG